MEMNKLNIEEQPHRRLNLLTGEWVLVSPHRAKRPWNGKVEKVEHAALPAHDPNCYLCAGNHRAGGIVNPDYKEPFVFQNDFAALLPETPTNAVTIGNLLQAKGESGICKVIVFSPRHDLTLPQLALSAIEKVVDTWVNEFKELSKNPAIKYIQIFENKGEIMGCSNPHPHGQIWASSSIPTELVKECHTQKAYYETHRKTLLSDYLALELQEKSRIVVENEDFVALVPFWAVWPFETMIVSKRPVQTILEFTAAEKKSFSDVLQKLTAKYDNLFQISFPYSAGMHQAPVNDGDHPEWHWHMHFYPPLLRSATVKKFMVGYEMLASPQRDITPEVAAAQLAALSDVRF
ncbi:MULTISPECIES: UDP-glucose--hexose-1-phosphate uridylyltransferase [Chitinophagaceae]